MKAGARFDCSKFVPTTREHKYSKTGEMNQKSVEVCQYFSCFVLFSFPVPIGFKQLRQATMTPEILTLVSMWSTSTGLRTVQVG